MKIKTVVNYRQARIANDGRDRNCGHCAKRKLMAIHNCGTGEQIGEGLRCAVIGLRESRRYTIATNHVCDRFEAKGRI